MRKSHILLQVAHVKTFRLNDLWLPSAWGRVVIAENGSGPMHFSLPHLWTARPVFCTARRSCDYIPTKIERLDKILQVSAQLFAQQGYHGTSTRELARTADLSENTLFRYFEHNEDIFWAALRDRLGGVQPKRGLIDGLLQCENPETLLPKIVAQLVDSAVLHPEVLRLVMVAFLELRSKAASVCGEFLAPIFSSVTSYLKANIERGKLRNLDPTLITAAMVATVLAHLEIVRIMERTEPSFADNRAAIQAFSTFWLEVLTPSHPDGLRGEVKPL